jgi:hypothetical protein
VAPFSPPALAPFLLLIATREVLMNTVDDKRIEHRPTAVSDEMKRLVNEISG